MTARRFEPEPFLAFCRSLGVHLTPAQRVLWSVVADGVHPRTLTGEDRRLAACLFSDAVIEARPNVLRVVAIVKGARIGGTWLGSLRLLHLALTVPLERLAPGEVASAVIVAPDLRLARQALRYVTGALDSRPELRRLVTARTSDSVTLRRPDGALVVIECLPATRGGSAVRGRSLVAVLLDEAAFFRDESYVVNDTEIYRAVAPRVLPGGQLLVVSTPWAEGGLLHELFIRNWSGGDGCLAVRAPTLLLRPELAGEVARERNRDPESAAREFDAEFMPAGSGLFFDPESIARAVDRDRPLSLPWIPGEFAGVGSDFGFASDHSACVVIVRRAGVLHVAAIEERAPRKGSPLVPSEVVAAFGALAARYGSKTLVADVHYREAVREHLAEHKLSLQRAPEGQLGKAQAYLATRNALREGLLRLPGHPRLLAQLKEVICKPTPGGGLALSSPRHGAGGHGDIVSALTLGVWAASRCFEFRPRTGGRTEMSEWFGPREIGEWHDRPRPHQHGIDFEVRGRDVVAVPGHRRRVGGF